MRFKRVSVTNADLRMRSSISYLLNYFHSSTITDGPGDVPMLIVAFQKVLIQSQDSSPISTTEDLHCLRVSLAAIPYCLGDDDESLAHKINELFSSFREILLESSLKEREKFALCLVVTLKICRILIVYPAEIQEWEQGEYHETNVESAKTFNYWIYQLDKLTDYQLYSAVITSSNKGRMPQLLRMINEYGVF